MLTETGTELNHPSISINHLVILDVLTTHHIPWSQRKYSPSLGAKDKGAIVPSPTNFCHTCIWEKKIDVKESSISSGRMSLGHRDPHSLAWPSSPAYRHNSHWQGKRHSDRDCKLVIGGERLHKAEHISLFLPSNAVLSPTENAGERGYVSTADRL